MRPVPVKVPLPLFNVATENFMLKNETAKWLYHSFAADMPIIDYHCHLDPKMIREDYRFQNVGELMLGGDHYKWRAMRSFGIEEKYITGNASWEEKFVAFATALEYCIGNPLYHWTHLELKRYFGINEPLTAESAKRIYDICSAKLQEDGYSARGLMEMSHVEVVCTTDDPLDSLEHHKAIAESGFSVKVLPTFRPDKAVDIQKPTFRGYIEKTGAKSFRELLSFMEARILFFHQNGCRLSDHGIEVVGYAEGDPEAVFQKAMAGKALSQEEVAVYQTALLQFFAKQYTDFGWTMQLHLGPIRNNNTKMFEKIGPDTGFDSMRDHAIVEPLSKLLDSFEKVNTMPKVILYSLNPNDNYSLATLMGCYQQAPTRSKIQLGSGWWFNDQRDGMEAQLRALGNLGVLGAFVGMLTDSRSLVSYPRHEYFRRILCNLIGTWVEEGEYPANPKALESIIRGICYNNAKVYFGF